MGAGNEFICHKVATFGFKTFSFIVNFHTCSHTLSPKFPLQFTLLISCLRSFFFVVSFKVTSFVNKWLTTPSLNLKDHLQVLNVRDLLSNVYVIMMNVTHTSLYNLGCFISFELFYLNYVVIIFTRIVGTISIFVQPQNLCLKSYISPYYMYRSHLN
jgi:hypothetical protein